MRILAVTLEEVIEHQIASTTDLEGLSTILRYLLEENSVQEDGTPLVIRQLVDAVMGLKIEIYYTEHPPPHFHVSAPGINASFDISNCNLIKGGISGKHHRIIKWWHQRSRSKLIEIWNSTRPANCTVGPINP